ncbi:MAG TPA: Type 1 glutamine amidotransferase-like domain-containing protein, partial [Desulfatiglandales bacterium]|nr:Type 1 glutamine amidotransferase-like domain-containing protein [Desulfatiglandales bacterium]
NQVVFKTILNEISKTDPLIAYVGAANNDDKWFYGFMGKEIIKAGKCTLKHALISSRRADLNKAQEIMQTADAVFMSGGDVEAGMRILESKNLINFLQDLYQKGKVFLGVSAGSIMLCKEWIKWNNPDDDSTAGLFPCLNIAPVICDTHAEEDEWEELRAALQLKTEGSIGYGISSGACLKVCPGGLIEAIGGDIARYIRRGHKVVKIDDLLPK